MILWPSGEAKASDRLTPLEGFVGVALTSPVSLEVAWILEEGAMLRLAGVWRGAGTGIGSGFLQGVDLTGRLSGSEGLRLWTEMDLRPATTGSGARLMTVERRDLAAAAAGTAGAPRPLEFSDEFNLALGMGEAVILELMLDTEEEEDDVFLLLSTTL